MSKREHLRLYEITLKDGTTLEKTTVNGYFRYDDNNNIYCGATHYNNIESFNLIKKQCSDCEQLLPIDNFGNNRSSKDGKHHSCKDCEHKRQSGKDSYYRRRTKKFIEDIKTEVESNPTAFESNGRIPYGVIYLICNVKSNRWYVGQTITPFAVRYSNFDMWFKEKAQTTKSDLIGEDIKLYGKKSFVVVNPQFKVAYSKEQLDKLEAYWIDYFNSYDNGYNATKGNIGIKFGIVKGIDLYEFCS